MIVTFLRSSSIGTYKMCQVQWLATYGGLGWKSPSNKAAALGNVTHKALEVLAWQSYYRARGVTEFKEESFGLLQVDAITPEWATAKAFDHYKAVEDHLRFYPSDLVKCQDWTRRCLELSGGLYDPANLDIVEPEKRFDLTIPDDWARYSFETPWGVREGQLSLKGTVDLVTRDKHDPEVIEVIDFKTGRRLDWSTGVVKSYRKLTDDPQLLLYAYAMHRVYPEAKAILMTIIYINDGGPHLLAFGPTKLAEAESMLRGYFESIRDTKTPTPRYGDHCRFCTYSKSKAPDPSSDETSCQFLVRKLRQEGTDAVLQQFGDPAAFDRYGSGGGRQATV